MPGNAPHRGEKVRACFENLLPDSRDIRERIARRFGAGSTDAFELLAEIGRDCVGAREILPEGQASTGASPLQAEPLSEAQVTQVLRGTTTANAIGLAHHEGDFRISIAGAQEKTALLLRDGEWRLPHGGTPTTHIFKLPLGLIGGMELDMRDSVENEWLCSLILKEFGLPVATCHPLQFEDVKVLGVERFDRSWWTGATGAGWLHEPRAGPARFLQGTAAVLDALRHRRPRQELQHLPAPRRALPADAAVRRAVGLPRAGRRAGEDRPLKARMAMAVRSKNAHRRMRDILRRHGLALGRRRGVVTDDGRPVEVLLDDVVARTPQVAAAARARLPEGFPTGVADGILDGLEDAARRLGSGR